MYVVGKGIVPMGLEQTRPVTRSLSQSLTPPVRVSDPWTEGPRGYSHPLRYRRGLSLAGRVRPPIGPVKGLLSLPPRRSEGPTYPGLLRYTCPGVPLLGPGVVGSEDPVPVR